MDEEDKELAQVIKNTGLNVLVTNTIMKSQADRRRLAQETLSLAEQAVAT